MTKTLGTKLAGLGILALFMLSAIPIALADVDVDLDSDLGISTDSVTVGVETTSESDLDDDSNDELELEDSDDDNDSRRPLLRQRVAARVDDRLARLEVRSEVRADIRERVQLRFEEAKERFDKAKEEYQQQRETSREAQEKYRECREDSENPQEDCEELQGEFLLVAKGRLNNAASVLDHLLTKLESKISEADYLDSSLQESMLVDVQAQLAEVATVDAMIEGLSEQPTREELQEALAQLKVVWENSHELLRKFSSVLAHSRFETGVVGQLESLLDRILVHVEGEEAEALVAEFEAHVAAAADFNTQAQAAISAEDLDLAKELEAQAREELRDAKEVLRDLLSLLREQGVSAADLRSRGELGIEARADARAAVATE